VSEIDQAAAELRKLIAGVMTVTGDSIARYLAEEVGECIGEHNKLSDGRGDKSAFAMEWAQATLMLSMLGQEHLTETGRAVAIDVEMAAQEHKWKRRKS
jgi:hypothetical protein